MLTSSSPKTSSQRSARISKLGIESQKELILSLSDVDKSCRLAATKAISNIFKDEESLMDITVSNLNGFMKGVQSQLALESDSDTLAAFAETMGILAKTKNKIIEWFKEGESSVATQKDQVDKQDESPQKLQTPQKQQIESENGLNDDIPPPLIKMEHFEIPATNLENGNGNGNGNDNDMDEDSSKKRNATQANLSPSQQSKKKVKRIVLGGGNSQASTINDFFKARAPGEPLAPIPKKTNTKSTTTNTTARKRQSKTSSDSKKQAEEKKLEVDRLLESMKRERRDEIVDEIESTQTSSTQSSLSMNNTDQAKENLRKLLSSFTAPRPEIGHAYDSSNSSSNNQPVSISGYQARDVSSSVNPQHHLHSSENELNSMLAAAQKSKHRANPKKKLKKLINDEDHAHPSNLPDPVLSDEQKGVIELAVSGESIFFTGPAGTGKSFLLASMISKLRQKHGYSSIFITASTGIAAVNIGGSTIHSFSGLGFADQPVKDLIAIACKNTFTKQRWNKCEVLIIDEISMLSGDYFEILDQVGQAVRKNTMPFGGVQLILCGDFLQLPPVIDKESGRSDRLCFEVPAWKRAIKHSIMLSKIFRQSDSKFVKILNELRVGKPSDESIKVLQSRNKREVNKENSDGIEPTVLYCLKSDVEKENSKKLADLPSEEHVYLSEDDSKHANSPYLNQMDKACPAPKRLCLKLNAQVILLKNLDVEQGLCNGSRGVVVDFEQTEVPTEKDEKKEEGKENEPKLALYPVVRFTSGVRRTLPPEDWTIDVAGQLMARRRQVPLGLAWALSVHKSQGMTLDRVSIDISNAFEPGMCYVAISRVRSLEGLQLIGFNPSRIKAHPRVLDFYAKLAEEQNQESEQYKTAQFTKTTNTTTTTTTTTATTLNSVSTILKLNDIELVNITQQQPIKQKTNSANPIFVSQNPQQQQPSIKQPSNPTDIPEERMNSISLPIPKKEVVVIDLDSENSTSNPQQPNQQQISQQISQQIPQQIPQQTPQQQVQTQSPVFAKASTLISEKSGAPVFGNGKKSFTPIPQKFTPLQTQPFQPKPATTTIVQQQPQQQNPIFFFQNQQSTQQTHSPSSSASSSQFNLSLPSRGASFVSVGSSQQQQPSQQSTPQSQAPAKFSQQSTSNSFIPNQQQPSQISQISQAQTQSQIQSQPQLQSFVPQPTFQQTNPAPQFSSRKSLFPQQSNSQPIVNSNSNTFKPNTQSFVANTKINNNNLISSLPPSNQNFSHNRNVTFNLQQPPKPSQSAQLSQSLQISQPQKFNPQQQTTGKFQPQNVNNFSQTIRTNFMNNQNSIGNQSFSIPQPQQQTQFNFLSNQNVQQPQLQPKAHQQQQDFEMEFENNDYENEIDPEMSALAFEQSNQHQKEMSSFN